MSSNGVYKATAQNNGLLLSVEHLRKKFCLHLLNGLMVEPIRDLSFSLKEKEFGILVGPSGAGKSTVLKCIYRSYLPTAGKVNFRLACGSWVDLAKSSEQEVLEIRKHEIACVTQFFRCAPRVAAEEIVARSRMSQNVPRDNALEEARSLLGHTGSENGKE